MQFLTRPCGACPFRTDRHGFLGARRAQEIMDTLADDREWFACHKTVEYTDDGSCTAGASQCGGALIFQRKTERTNIVTRIAFALQIIDPEALDMDSPVFDSAAAFVAHHCS